MNDSDLTSGVSDHLKQFFYDWVPVVFVSCMRTKVAVSHYSEQLVPTNVGNSDCEEEDY